MEEEPETIKIIRRRKLVKIRHQPPPEGTYVAEYTLYGDPGFHLKVKAQDELHAYQLATTKLEAIDISETLKERDKGIPQ